MLDLMILAWLFGLTVGLVYAVFKIGQILALLDNTALLHQKINENMESMTVILEKTTEDIKTLSRFTHTHEGQPLYTFNIKDIN